MSLPPAKRFNWSNLGVRVASATVLVPTALAAVWFDTGLAVGGWPFVVARAGLWPPAAVPC